MSSPPSTLGQYQIIREIARSNDIVYEAYDPLMNRRVAVKELMMPSGSTGPQQDDRISRFKREAQAAGTLNHPNIMTVYSFAEDAGRTFMAMEYLDGQTLRNEIDTKGSISPDRAIEIASAVLSGLQHAHNMGVIHRDIKPDNIQLLSNGTVKITDFGIARLTFQPNLTVDGQVFGTPSYMSPEQVVGKEIDARSDLFSVGVMLYEMLVGKKPFSGDSVVSTTYAIMNAEPEQPQGVPWPIWSVIKRALEKAPAMRYAGAEEMKKALADAISPNAGVLPVDPHVPQGYSPAVNPYLAPPPLPAASAGNPFLTPSGGAHQPIQAPYNPYSMPGPSANPYAGQYTPTPAPVPTTYPYNPYQGSGVNPAQQPGGGMLAPIYYPPPPRLPLLKPETSMFIKKLMLALLIFGTLGALLVLGTQVIMQMAQRSSEQDNIAAAAIAEKNAQAAQKQGDLPKAEYDGSDAREKDPHNPDISASQGNLYMKSAEQETDSESRANLYLRAATEFKQAADDETNLQSKADDANHYADAAYNAAECSIQMSNSDANLTRDSRRALEDAKAYVSKNQDMVSRIDQVIAQLRA